MDKAGFWKGLGRHVGTILALFSVLSASWAHFSRLAARVGAVGRFSCVLECSGHDFGAPKPPFWMPKRLIFPWFSSIMHELLQETLACIYYGFSSPLAARRYVRSTLN